MRRARSDGVSRSERLDGIRSSPWSSCSSNTSGMTRADAPEGKMGRRDDGGERGSSGVSDRAQMLRWSAASAKDDDSCAPPLAAAVDEWENELEKPPACGGRRGELFETIELALSDEGIGGRLVYDVDKGEGRDGEDAKPAAPEIGRGWLKPADGEPATPTAAGGPYGSRKGDDADARREGDWTEEEKLAEIADLMGTGCEMGVEPALTLTGDVPSSLLSLNDLASLPSARSRAERCCSFLLRRSIDMGSPGRTCARAPGREIDLRHNTNDVLVIAQQAIARVLSVAAVDGCRKHDKARKVVTHICVQTCSLP